MAIILIIKTEDGQLAELPILQKVILGRSSSSDYKIADAKISSSHCSFERTPKGELLFIDLESTNGSYLNNSRISQHHVHIHDVIKIGNTLITIDESKLTKDERLTIGVSHVNTRNDKTLPSLDNNNGPASPPAEIGTKAKKVVLNKSIKEKKRPANLWDGAGENIIDQEESSGRTKFLKLDKDIKKK